MPKFSPISHDILMGVVSRGGSNKNSGITWGRYGDFLHSAGCLLGHTTSRYLRHFVGDISIVDPIMCLDYSGQDGMTKL